MYRNTAYLAGLCLVSVLAAEDGRAQTAYVNGHWFDGDRFSDRAVTVMNGRFDVGAQGAATVVDLEGGYVVPPFCEGHNHNVAVGKPEERNARYLASGVFYVQILNDAPDIAAAEAAFWRRPDTADVVFAHAAVTGPGGHPVELIEGIAKGGGYPPGTRLKGHTYFEIGTVAEMEASWPSITATQPDVVKFFLQYSEEPGRQGNEQYYGNRGLSPAVFRRGVELAHREHRRVVAHVVSADDFHVAVDAGVDVIAHLPGYMQPAQVAQADIAAAAKKGIAVITTASLARALAKSSLAEVQLAQKDNLSRLRDAGVTLIVGSDSWADTSHGEARYLRALGIFTDAELLRMWTTNCVGALYPGRRAGRLSQGYDADFLVLDGDPLVDFEATRRIRLRVKGGSVITPAPSVGVQRGAPGLTPKPLWGFELFEELLKPKG